MCSSSGERRHVGSPQPSHQAEYRQPPTHASRVARIRPLPVAAAALRGYVWDVQLSRASKLRRSWCSRLLLAPAHQASQVCSALDDVDPSCAPPTRRKRQGTFTASVRRHPVDRRSNQARSSLLRCTPIAHKPRQYSRARALSSDQLPVSVLAADSGVASQQLAELVASSRVEWSGTSCATCG